MFSILIRPSALMAADTPHHYGNRFVRKRGRLRLFWRRGSDGHLEGRWWIPGSSKS